MAADIHAVALVADRARDAAHIFDLFEHDGLNIGAFDEFEGCGETGWSRTYNECFTMSHFGGQ